MHTYPCSLISISYNPFSHSFTRNCSYTYILSRSSLHLPSRSSHPSHPSHSSHRARCDLPNREVSAEEAKGYAQKNEFPYFETSAKERINVNEVFYQLVREIRKQLDTGKKKKSKKCAIL